MDNGPTGCQIDDAQCEIDKMNISNLSKPYEIITSRNGLKYVKLIENRSDPVLEAVLKDDHVALQKALDDNPIDWEIVDYPRHDFSCPPVYIACLRKEPDCLKVLLNSGASVLACDISGVTGIHVASYHGHMGILEYIFDEYPEGDERLMKYMANKRTMFRSTPLHFAVLGKSPHEVVKFLLKRFASPLVLDKEKQLPSCICNDLHTRILLQMMERIQQKKYWEDKAAAEKSNNNTDSELMETSSMAGSPSS